MAKKSEENIEDNEKVEAKPKLNYIG